MTNIDSIDNMPVSQYTDQYIVYVLNKIKDVGFMTLKNEWINSKAVLYYPCIELTTPPSLSAKQIPIGRKIIRG